jgi:hypothetical protein
MMAIHLSFDRLREQLSRVCCRLPDVRRGQNTQYTISDAALGAFACFFLQSPSFLAFQKRMEEHQGRNNARSLFGVQRLPSDDQIRNLLDPVPPQRLVPPFWAIYRDLAASGALAAYRSAGTLLCALDGTRYFDSWAVRCAQCSTTTTEKGTLYHHGVLLPALVRPDSAEVIVLEPEFILPQDGQTKQDCESAAAKRWLIGRGDRPGAGVHPAAGWADQAGL